MPRVTQAHLDARRREILGAAFRCFSRHGFHATTMQRVAEEADLSAGALYRYFDGKQELIEALAELGRNQKREALEGLEPGGGADALADAVVGMLDLLRSVESDASARLDVRLWAEALDRPDLRSVVEGELAALREPIADYLRVEREAGRVASGVDPDALARSVVALLTGFELQRAYEPDVDVAGYVRTVRRLLSRG